MPQAIFLIILISLFLVGCGNGENNIISQATQQTPDSFMGEYKPINKTSNTNQSSNLNTVVPQEVAAEAESALEALQKTSGAARDVTRLADIATIQTALEAYKAEQGAYPTTLNGLVNQEYLTSIPVNPTPGGQDYTYTPIGSLPAQYYDLCYELEEGTAEVSPGYHCVNP